MHEIGGAGGGLEGFPSFYNKGQGGTQTQGGFGLGKGQFGFGGSRDDISQNGNGAGGGGYFGGGTSNVSYLYGGGGGSSFISGHAGCNAIDKDANDINNMTMTGQSIHYSTYRFYHTTIIDGKSQMPSPTNSSTETGHCSGGAIRITRLEYATCQQIPISVFRHFLVISFLDASFSM